MRSYKLHKIELPNLNNETVSKSLNHQFENSLQLEACSLKLTYNTNPTPAVLFVASSIKIKAPFLGLLLNESANMGRAVLIDTVPISFSLNSDTSEISSMVSISILPCRAVILTLV